MTPFSALVFVGAAIGVIFDSDPVLRVALNCQPRPGESRYDYSKREMARLDAVMQAMMAESERINVGVQSTLKKLEKVLAENEVRAAEATALRALAGGVADHPKCQKIITPTPEQVQLQAKIEASQDQLKEKFARDAAEQPAIIAERNLRQAKTRELTQLLLERLAEKERAARNKK